MRFSFVSPKFCQILNIAEEDLLRDPSLAFSMAHPEDSESLIETNKYATETGESFHWEGRFIVNDKTIYLEISSEPTFLPNGDTLWSGIINDVTERKKLEEEIKNTKENLDEVLKESITVVYRCEPTGDYPATFISENIKRQLGYEPDQFIKDPSFWASNIHPDDREHVFSNLGKLFEHGYHSHEYRFLNGHGDYICMHDELRLVKDHNGQVKDIVGNWVDISERKQIEADLIQAKLQADIANNAKSDFLSSMSHELRTPLNAILGFSQLIEMHAKDEKTRDNSQEIINAGEHLLNLINEILDLSKIESGNVELSIEKIGLNEILKEALSLIHPFAEKHSIKIDNKVSTSFNINVDKMRFKQVLLNILSNAIKYNSEKGKVIIDSTTENNMLRLSIADTGAGLTPEQLTKLFEPFERLGAENSNIEGTGLGLKISKDLTELMGGKIAAESKESRFWIQIPFT